MGPSHAAPATVTARPGAAEICASGASREATTAPPAPMARRWSATSATGVAMEARIMVRLGGGWGGLAWEVGRSGGTPSSLLHLHSPQLLPSSLPHHTPDCGSGSRTGSLCTAGTAVDTQTCCSETCRDLLELNSTTQLAPHTHHPFRRFPTLYTTRSLLLQQHKNSLRQYVQVRLPQQRWHQWAVRGRV